jgi:hypothetical protein
MRTTLDIDDPILRDLKRLREREGKSLGRLVSDLLALALAQVRDRRAERPAFRWNSQPMSPRVNLEDRDAILQVLDRSAVREPRSKRTKG